MVHAESGNPLSPLKPAKNWDEIAGNYPMLKPRLLQIETGYHEFQPLLDSSNMKYENWVQIANVIAENYNDYSGFVILHGTDTMCYTASALSFMLENLAKPVVLTGSQIPMVKPRSDAIQNLITSIQIASSDISGFPLIPEVCIFFRDILLRGNRSRKLSSSGYSGFSSPNYPVLATAGERVEFNTKFIRKLPEKKKKFYKNTSFDTNVIIIELFPGFHPHILRKIFEEKENEKNKIKGLILKTFGSGNAPENVAFLSAIENIVNKGVIIINVTQCPQGMVELGLYETSLGLLNRGVVSGADMTPEAAVCKLMYLLGKKLPIDEIKKNMQINMRGEQSISIYNVDFDKPGKADPVFIEDKKIYNYIDLNKLEGASIRVNNIKFIHNQQKYYTIKLKIFINHPNPEQNTSCTDPRCVGYIERTIGDESSVDIFSDLSPSCIELIKPGKIARFSIVTEQEHFIQWDKVTFSFYSYES